MAARFWIGGGTNSNWNASPTTNWAATSGGTTRVAVPTSADDVTFDGAGTNGNTNSTISATITILSLTVTAGYTATLTHNAVLTVGGNITLNTGYTIAGSSGLTINATSTITSNGKTWPNVLTLSGSNTITLSGNFTVGSYSGTGTTQTINSTTSEVLTCAGVSVGAGTLTGTASITMTGGSITGKVNNNLTFAGNVTITGTLTRNSSSSSITYSSGTITVAGSTLSLTNNGGTYTFNTGAAITWETISVTVNATLSLSSTLNVTSLTAANSLTFSGSFGITCGTLTFSSTSASTITFVHAVTYTITTSFVCFLSQASNILLITSDDSSVKAILTLVNGALCNCLASFTRIDASNGRTINAFNGTITSCTNIREFHDLQTIAG